MRPQANIQRKSWVNLPTPILVFLTEHLALIYYLTEMYVSGTGLGERKILDIRSLSLLKNDRKLTSLVSKIEAMCVRRVNSSRPGIGLNCFPQSTSTACNVLLHNVAL